MQRDHLISAAEFCSHHHIETAFIHSLNEYGLLQLITIDDNNFIDAEDLGEVEILLRLHYELHINLEGIDVVKNLLKQMQQLQSEMTLLKNKLRLYHDV